MALLGCVECGKNLIQNEALGLVIRNGFHQPIEDDASPVIELSASQEYFEKFLNEDSEDDETNVSLSADEWMNFKTHKVFIFYEDEDAMRSKFVQAIEDYKSSFQEEQWATECQCSQCRVLQVVAFERAYIIKNGTFNTDDDIKMIVPALVMANIYFENYRRKFEDFSTFHFQATYHLKDYEWDAILDKWEDFKDKWQYNIFHYHCDVRHGLIDTMWSAIGIPVQVIHSRGFMDTDVLDIRIRDTPLWNVEIDDLREAVWSEIGDSLMSSGWHIEELFFKEFSGNGSLLEDNEYLQDILREDPNLELVLVDMEVSDNEADEDEETVEEESEEEEEMEVVEDLNEVKLMVRQMFEPFTTRETGALIYHGVREFKLSFIFHNDLNLDLDDLRVVCQDRDLDDNETWDELGYEGGDTINIQVFIRGRGGGGGKKRKLEDIIEEKEDYSNKLTGKTSEDNPFKAKIENLYEKMASDEFGQPIADLVQSMGQEQLQHLSEKYWGSNHSKYERYLPEIAENLVPLMGEIVKVERHANEAKKYLNAILEEFFVKEFNDGNSVKNELFETLLEVMADEINKEQTRIQTENEIERRAQERAQQLLLTRANAPNGDVPMTPVG